MSSFDINIIKEEMQSVLVQLLDCAKLKAGDVLVLGCSSSEVIGERIGTSSSIEVAQALYDVILPELSKRGIYLAAQCCEHLNRAIIIERAAVPTKEIVNARPAPKAGGSFATAAYDAFSDPVAIEEITADAGLDIGNTLIGMHLKRVAVPVRLSLKTIGAAPLVAARTRPKFVGGARTVYDESLL